VPAQIMWDSNVGAVPVLGDSGSVIGMVTDRDICMAAYTQGRALDSVRVATAMAKKVIVVQAHDPIEEAERLMQAHQVRRLPVVNGGRRLVGILSVGDLAQRTKPDGAESVSSAELVRTIAAISETRPFPVRS
jgi:CBS domain-containing protein